MSNLDKYLQSGIPLAEAADFFISVRTFEKAASESYQPPDETGALEGAFAAPVEQVLAHMGTMVQNELKTQYAYMAFANSLRDLSHHAIASEFEDHADDETEHAEFLMRRMGVLGGPLNLPDIPAPPAMTDPVEIVQTLIRMEQEGIANWRILRNLIGDENPMRFKVEEYLTKEQEHLDELWQLLPHHARQAVLNESERGQSAPEGEQKTAEWVGYRSPARRFLAGMKAGAIRPTKLTGQAAVRRWERGNRSGAVGTAVGHLGAIGGLAGGSYVLGKKVGEENAEERKKKDPKGKEKSSEMQPLTGSAAGQHPPVQPLPPLTGGAAGQHTKMSSIDPFAGLSGILMGTGRGRETAGQVAASLAPEGRVTRSEDTARLLALGGAPAGALGALALAHKHRINDRIIDAIQAAHPGGLLGHPGFDRALLSAGLPIAEGLAGGMAGGALTGAAVGGIQRLRGPLHAPKDKDTEKKAEAKDDRSQVESGRARAIANLSSGFTSSEASRGEDLGGVLGRVGGAGGGALLGRSVAQGMGASPSAQVAALLGGAALGQSIGGSAGKGLGHEIDRARFQSKHASVPVRFEFALAKLAEDMGLGDPAAQGTMQMQPQQMQQQAPVSGLEQGPPAGPDPELVAYLQQEQAGRQAEEEGQAAFYKQKFDQAAQELQAAQQQAQATQQQLQQMQQQQAQGQQMQEQALAQARQVQEAAMQNATAAHAAAGQAMQRSLSSSNELLQQQQLSVGMRDAVQAMKSSLLSLAQQQLPPATTMEAGVQGAAQQQQADAEAQQAAMMQENDPTAAAQGDPAANQAGAPAAATPPGSPVPGEQGPEAGGNAQAQGQAPEGMAPQTQQTTPDPEKTASDRFVGALMGGAVGGIGNLIESRRSNDPLRQKVQALEAKEQAGGGFGNALNLAQARLRLAAGDLAEKHPIGSSLLAAGMGASIGAGAAPDVREIINQFRGA